MCCTLVDAVADDDTLVAPALTWNGFVGSGVIYALSIALGVLTLLACAPRLRESEVGEVKSCEPRRLEEAELGVDWVGASVGFALPECFSSSSSPIGCCCCCCCTERCRAEGDGLSPSRRFNPGVLMLRAKWPDCSPS
jgi:hypothetical protein